MPRVSISRKSLAALVLSGLVFSPQAAAQLDPGRFQVGLYGAGADRTGMAYYLAPAGYASPESYFRKAFLRAEAEGFDYVTFNHIPPDDLPAVLDQAGVAGIPLVYQGGDWPSYYNLNLYDPDTGSLVLDTTMGFQEFPPEGPGSPYVRERLHRRDLMRSRMLPWIERSWPELAAHPALLGYTPVEEPPVDSMIDHDLAEVARAFRRADLGKNALAMIHKDLRTLQSGVPLMRPDLVRAGFFGMGADWSAGEFGENWWYSEDATDDAATTCAASGARYHVYLSGAYEEVLEGGVWRPGSFRRVTREELRAQVWLAIANGANGVEVFCYNSIDDTAHLEACRERGLQPIDFWGEPDLWHRMIGLFDMRDRETELLADLRAVLAEVRPLFDVLGRIRPVPRREGDQELPQGPFAYRRDGVSAIRVREFVDPVASKRVLLLWNADVVRERPIDVDLALWARGVPLRALPGGARTHAARLGSSMLLPPGGGVLIELDR